MTPSSELLVLTMVWINTQTGLPLPEALPTVTKSSQCELALMLNHPSCNYMDIMGVHLDDTIYLHADWTPKSIPDLSVLVHELVHFMQWNAGHTGCLEALAYETQGEFLARWGQDFLTAYGITAEELRRKMECRG